jgi:hypothetical protein
VNVAKKRAAESGPTLTPAAKRERGARLLAEGNRLIAEATFEEMAAHHDTFNQNTSPLKRRQFLEAARAGKFPSTKIGSLVTAKRADVFAFMQREGINRGAQTDLEGVEDVIADILSGGDRR